MSKELVSSAASHERRVAILEEGQLVEIYIEREKEFALVGSIYKGKVTRVLPGMQSAFVDIGLDGDAFLYVSDVFENLEDYDHVHPHEQPQTSVASLPPAIGSPVEVLPGESLARASEHHEETHHDEFHQHEAHAVDEQRASHEDAPAAGDQNLEHHDALPSARPEEHHAEAPEERQPDSNASAPQNFAPHYNPTQNYPVRGGNDRPGQNFGRGADRSNDRGGDRGGDRGRGGRWGRRGGRHRGGRPQSGPGGRNLPPSKYASPQGGESRGYDNRGGQSRSYDNRRVEAPRSSVPSVTSVSEEEIILPGESLAKYRNKPVAAPAPVPVIEHEKHEERPAVEEITPRAAANLPAAAASGGVPRRFSGGLPRWLLADAGAEVEAAPSGETVDSVEETSSASTLSEVPQETAVNHVEAPRNDVELNEDQVAALASGFVEAKHEETQEEAEADAVVGGAEFDEEEDEEQSEEVEETIVTEVSQLSEEEAEEVEAGRAADRAEFAADVAQEHAEHDAAHGTHEHGEQEQVEHEYVEAEHAEEEVLSAAPGGSVAEIPAVIEDDVILLPGETRAPRIGGPAAHPEDFPRDSGRIGGQPRLPLPPPVRSGGRGPGWGGPPDGRGGDSHSGG